MRYDMVRFVRNVAGLRKGDYFDDATPSGGRGLPCQAQVARPVDGQQQERDRDRRQAHAQRAPGIRGS